MATYTHGKRHYDNKDNAPVLSCVWLFVMPWTVARQAHLSMEFPRGEYWSGLPLSTSGNLCDTGTEPAQSVCPALVGGFFTTMPLGSPHKDNNQTLRSMSVLFSRSGMSDSLQPHELQHARRPCLSPTPEVHSESHPLSQWCHPATSSSVIPFSSCPQSLTASESFPMSQHFSWGGQSTELSALASYYMPITVKLSKVLEYLEFQSSQQTYDINTVIIISTIQTRKVRHSSVHFSSVAQLCLTLCDPMNHSASGLPIHHQLPEFIQTHVHRVGDAIQPSHPLSASSPPAPSPSQHQSLFQWVNTSYEVAKILEFQL